MEGDSPVDAHHIDRLSRLFASRRLSRRTALATSAATAATAIAGRSVIAQDATPEAGGDKQSFLFVQLAEDGVWKAKPDEPGVYTLTLAGASGQTLFFSDRPERIVGTVPTEQFFDGLGFTPQNPPNAALVVKTPDGERDVLVVELFNPVYSEAFGETAGVQVTYEARVLEGYTGEGLATWSKEQQDDLLPEKFTDVSLFIDDCSDGTVGCTTFNGATCPGGAGGKLCGLFGPMGFCWDWSTFICVPCEPYGHSNPSMSDVYTYWKNNCNATWSTCGNIPGGGGCDVEFYY
jgi:hypothetical protein